MGTSPLAIALTTGLLLVAQAAHAQDDACVGTDAGGRAFPVCFDPGNRLLIEASTAGYGGELRLRHRIRTEPGVWWRLEHRMLAAHARPTRLQGTLYEGRYLRHARDGHIISPLRPTKKIFVPFDVGAEATLGRIDWDHAGDRLEVDAVRVAVLFELTRASHARRRLAVGTIARWGMHLDEAVSAVRAHQVAPFSRAVVDGYLESRDGLTLAGVRVEAGTAWSSDSGWQSDVTAEATVERVLLALNDRPLALYLAGGYERPGAGWHGAVGLRFALATWDARPRALRQP